MTTLNSSWQVVASYSQNVEGYDVTLLVYAYATEDISGNYSTVHTTEHIVISANYLSVYRWYAALDAGSNSGDYTTLDQGANG